jgi:glycosyltransferase involved in cell wall biosynthesis
VRVVHVSDCYAPRTGGIESQVRDLAAHQARAGHAVHVLTATAAADGGLRTTGTEASGVRVHRMASALTFGVPVHPLGGRLTRRAFERLEPDVVHVHAGVVSPFAHDGARAARSLGLPLAITWHCMLTGIEPAVRLGALLTGWRTAPAAVSAVSTVAAERVAAALGRQDVAVVTNGLDVEVWRPPVAAPAVDGDGPLRVVATQRLAPRKRAVPLLRAFARAVEILGRGDDAGGRRALLTVVGSGPDEVAVRREAQRLGVADAVTLLGRVDRTALPALYRGQHVFLSATEKEAFGLAALEARAAGLAVVARAGTGISEFVTEGTDGFLAADDDGLTDALTRLASDAVLRDRILGHNRSVAPAADFADVVAAAEREYARAARLVRPLSTPAG